MIRFLAIALLAVAGNTAAFASDNDTSAVQSWLDRMSESVRERNYQGEFVYQQDQTLESMMVVHMVDEHGEHERLVSLNGVAREVIRNHDTVTCIMPDAKAVWVANRAPKASFKLELPRNLSELTPYYTLELGDLSRVADRDAQYVGILPKDDYRFGYRLWLDQETSLPLQIERVASDGKVRERMMFVHLDTSSPINRILLKPATEGKAYSWKVEENIDAPKNAPGFGWEVRHVPDGYQMDSQRFVLKEDSGRRTQQRVYSDGLSSFSVYMEPLTQEAMLGHSSMGSINAYGAQLGFYQVTVIGEVPSETLAQVGNSVVLGSNR